MNNRLGKIILDAMTEKGMDVSELRRMSGIHSVTIRSWISGLHLPNRPTVECISEILGLDAKAVWALRQYEMCERDLAEKETQLNHYRAIATSCGLEL